MWHSIRGHDAVVERFRTALARGRLAQTFLFVGPEGVGKRTFALELARGILCLTNGPTSIDACGGCESCWLFAVGNHPDLHSVAKPKDKSRVTLEQLLGDDEHRMRAGLCYDMSLRSYLGNRKIALIDDADTLDAGQGESANSLLKILEQPPGNGIFILLSTDINRQLPTIRSRSQLVRFNALSEADVAAILVEKQLSTDPDETARLAALSDGSVATALANADFEARTFRASFLKTLAKRPLPNVALARETAEHVDAAGKEAPLRRARLKRLMGTGAEFYRELARGLCDAPAAGDADTKLGVQLALKQPGWDVDAVLAAAEECLEATVAVDRNANQALVIEAWLDKLARTLSPPLPV